MRQKKKYTSKYGGIRRSAAISVILLLLSTASACGSSGANGNQAVNTSDLQGGTETNSGQEDAREVLSAGQSESSVPEERKDTFTGEDAALLSSGQTAAIRDYMDAYYRSLSELQTEDLSAFFSEGASGQVLMNESALDYVTGLREMQDTDLHLLDYRYEMDVTLVQEEEEGTEVQVTETGTLNFVQSPDIDTTFYNIRHVFLLQETDEGWKIVEHWQRDNIWRNLLGDYWNWENRTLTMEDPETYFPEQVERLLTEARQEKLERTGRNQTEVPDVDHPYQREAAVSYSDLWVGQRNEEWSDFTGRGGNCQNFVSQSLLAGGIPMDGDGDAVWYWIGEDRSSASWVGVDEFYRYADQNSGYGLSAEAEAGYYDGEIGDLIRMGSETDWNHVVIIAEVIRDQEGNTVDYLINSNTADVKNFPVSAYPNPKQRLMKIYGWNEQ